MAKFIVKHLDNGEVVEIHTIEANTLRGAKTIATKLVGWFVMGRDTLDLFDEDEKLVAKTVWHKIKNHPTYLDSKWVNV